MAGQETVTLDGESLNIQTLCGLSSGNDSRIEIDDRGLEKIQAARRVVGKYLENGTLAYGLTTGLGARVSEMLSYDEPDQNREPSIGRPQHRTR